MNTDAHKKKCHGGPCKDCEVWVKKRCFCGKERILIKCCDVKKEEDKKQQGMLSCKMKCGRQKLKCEHICEKICHEGPCESIGDNKCEGKVDIICPCGRRKEKWECEKVKDNGGKKGEKKIYLKCDEECEARRLKRESDRQKKTQSKDIIITEEKKDVFKKLVHKRTSAKWKVDAEEKKLTLWQKYGKIIQLVMVLLFIVAFCFASFILLKRK